MSPSSFEIAKSLREAVKLSAAIAMLFLGATLSCLYWAYSRGAFGATAFEYPVYLEDSSSVNVHFSVTEKGDHDVEIQYSYDASEKVRKVHKDLEQISGKAILRTGGVVLAYATLPVEHERFTNGFGSMILFTRAMEPRTDYDLELEINRLPSTFAGSQGTVRVELDPTYYLIFPQLALLAVWLLLLGLLCTFVSIRWWRVANSTALKNSSATGGHNEAL